MEKLGFLQSVKPSSKAIKWAHENMDCYMYYGKLPENSFFLLSFWIGAMQGLRSRGLVLKSKKDGSQTLYYVMFKNANGFETAWFDRSWLVKLTAKKASK